MNLMMFPKMAASHDEGWAWLMQVHPSVAKVFALYVAPMALIPPAMLLYAVHAYGGIMGSVTMDHAWRLAIVFYLAELMAVPVMAAVIQRLGDVVDTRPEYHDAFAFAAAVPTPLWLSALALFIPSLTVVAVATAVALFISALLIYEGCDRVFGLNDEGKSRLLAGSILAAGLVAWVVLMGLAFVSWGWAVS